jgi:ABC-type transport system involved in cytochrome c biogenesis permease subunit
LENQEEAKMYQLSSIALTLSIVIYCVAFIFFSLRWGSRAYALTLIGLGMQIVYFLARWSSAGHIPTSNLFEFITFLSMMIFAAFTIMYWFYRRPLLGVFTIPFGLVILLYACVFPQEVQPLIPALSSYWLKIHVTTAALGEAFFAISFVFGFMYLIRTADYTARTKKAKMQRVGIETMLCLLLIFVGFISSIFMFRGIGYHAQFVQAVDAVAVNELGYEIPAKKMITIDYHLPAIIKPFKSETIKMDSFLGWKQPPFESFSWLKGANSGRKLNTIIWSIGIGLLLYAALRTILRKPLGASIQPILGSLEPRDLDELCYKAIAWGFPIFTLGALVFAMIWAHMAWSRFWGWDPKEVWALITWLFYSIYLHLRLSKGWHGAKSAWFSVTGFIVVMFTLIGVNLVIAGLHSYAGVN